MQPSAPLGAPGAEAAMMAHDLNRARTAGGEGVRAYLDHNATSPLRPEARAAVMAALDAVGNASSVHAEGRDARARVETARAQVASLLGASGRQVTFSSGATEALAQVLHPAVEIAGQAKPCDVLLASAVEHPAVLKGHRFAPDRVELVPVDREGRIDLAALGASLARHSAAGRRAMVALMAANNETGVLQPVMEACRTVHTYDGVLVCDAVQAAGRMPFRLDRLPVDFLVLSAHKLGGPQGAGALVAGHPDSRVAPLMTGGGQESGRRGGTLNVAAIAGFGAAAEAARRALDSEAGSPGEALRLERLRDDMERALLTRIPGTVILGGGAERIANTSLVAFSGIKAETLVIALDLSHVSVSAGAACSSGKVGASHVLDAMGVEGELARGAVRLSLGWSSSAGEVDRALAALEKAVAQVRGRPSQAA
mgnify:FL=1